MSSLYMHIRNPTLIPTTPNSELPLLILFFLITLLCSLIVAILSLSFSKAMNKFKKSQVLVLFVLAVLLLITPFLPSSLLPTYVYFIINFLIMALFAEAGLISSFARPLEDKKQYASVTNSTSEKREVSNSTPTVVVGDVSEHVEKSASERIVCVTKVDKVQNSLSMPTLVQNSLSIPTLFFIGGGEADEEVMDEEFEAEEELGRVKGQELFAKADAFIGNFYKQLKMQRKESWIYQKAL